MNPCKYCENRDMTHVVSQPIVNILSKLDKDERAKLVRFMLQTDNNKYHTTHAISDIKETYCFSCGEIMERDDDGDRYYYMCPNMSCKSYNGEDVV